MRSGARRQLLRPLEILREAAPHLLEKAGAEDMLTQTERVLFEYQAQRAQALRPLNLKPLLGKSSMESPRLVLGSLAAASTLQTSQPGSRGCLEFRSTSFRDTGSSVEKKQLSTFLLTLFAHT